MPLHHASNLLTVLIWAHVWFWFGLSVLILLNCFINLFFFRKPRVSIVPNDELPFISVLVPARNEEKVIEACVRSLLQQNYPNFEVIVLDDNSEDLTYDILCRLRDQDYRLRVLVGAQLPEGWYGKPHACWQMAKAATGEYLLFTDADCFFSPDALLFAVGGMAGSNSDVVSLMPDYVAETIWEKLTIPLLVVIPLAFLPFALVRGTSSPTFAAANGAFIFLSKQHYFEVDGHRAVKQELTEDIKFSQLVKRLGLSLSYMDGKNVYKVRIYTSINELWVGFTRILMPAFDSLGYCILGIFLTINLFILPPALAAYGYLTGQAWAPISAAAYLCAVATRLIIATAFDRDNPLMAPLNPVNWLIAFVVACGSIHRNLSGNAEWKGRRYKAGSGR